MATRVRFEFYGEAQVARTIMRPAERLESPHDLWNELADDFVRIEKHQFSTEGGYASGGWAPLSPAYAAWKARQRSAFGRKGSKRRARNEAAGGRQAGNRILVLYGDLKDSLTRRPLGIEYFGRSSMVIGSDVEYGRHHQRGGPHLPRRRPIEFRETDRRGWVKRIQRFIVTGRVGGTRREF